MPSRTHVLKIHSVSRYDNDERMFVTSWTKTSGKVNIQWMNGWWGGPGTGNYIFYVRGIDPAGNKDSHYVEGINMYSWRYLSPLPWRLIFAVTGSCFGVLFVAYL